MNILKALLKVLGWVIAALVACLIVAFVVLWIYSPGKAQPLVDASGVEIPGSISTIDRVMLGGIEQYMIIRGADRTKPVMLFLHGGPGSPEFPMLRQTNLGLEADFVMVYWEQRGAGMSYSSDIGPESMNLEQFVSDTRELSGILADRFGRDKIFLMGHSWGTLVGILAAQKYPDLYHAYFGVGQAADQDRGEQMSLQWVKDQASLAGDMDTVEALAQLTFPDRQTSGQDWMTYIQAERGYLNRYGGGVSHEPTLMLTILGWVLATPEYSVMDKLDYFRGALFSLNTLWPEIMHTNLIDQGVVVDIPVYIFQGAFDYQTPYPIARAFFEALEAPQKEFITFEHSAHSPNMEEPAMFNAAVRMRAGLE